MKTKVKMERQDKPVEAPVSCNNDILNFDLWLKEVRSQLVAALKRRAANKQD